MLITPYRLALSYSLGSRYYVQNIDFPRTLESLEFFVNV